MALHATIQLTTCKVGYGRALVIASHDVGYFMQQLLVLLVDAQKLLEIHSVPPHLALSTLDSQALRIRQCGPSCVHFRPDFGARVSAFVLFRNLLFNNPTLNL